MPSSHTLHPARYRVHQFFLAVRAYLPVWAGGFQSGLTHSDASLVKQALTTPAQQQLFNRMPPNDQRHALAVARILQQAGHTDSALMQAALLHDVGKSLGQPLFYRVLIVLFEAFWPAALTWLSRDTTRTLAMSKIGWWRRPFVIHAHHPALGATWAKSAGCEAEAVRLIAGHEEKANPQDKLLLALQWADNLN